MAAHPIALSAREFRNIPGAPVVCPGFVVTEVGVAVIVRVQSTELSGVQRFVRRLLTDWGPGTGQVGGVALLGSPLPRSRRRSAPATDLLVWTPHGCTLVVLADFGSVQHGVLTTGPTGRWSVDDTAADLRTGKSTPNPILRGRKLRGELAAIFRRNGLSEHIDVLVVLIPKTGSRISWTPHPPEDGIETVLVRIGASAGLAEYFERPVVGEMRWRGEDIARAFEMLGVSRHLPDSEELANEGFLFAPGSAADLRAVGEEPSGPVAPGGSRTATALFGPSVLAPGQRTGTSHPAVPAGFAAVAEQDVPLPSSPRKPDVGGQNPEYGEPTGARGNARERSAGAPVGPSEARSAYGEGSAEGADSPASGEVASGRFGAADRASTPATAARRVGDFPVGGESTPDGRGTATEADAPGMPRPAARLLGAKSESAAIGDSARYPARPPLPGWSRAGDTGPNSDADIEPSVRTASSVREPGESRSDASGAGRRWRAAAGVPAGVRRGLAGARDIAARARRVPAAPRSAARPPREPAVHHRLPLRGTDLRYPAALGLAGVVLAAVTATVFAASGFARFDVAEYGALCGGGAGNPAAAPYSAAGPSPVYLGGELPEYTAFEPSAVWRPIDPGAVQLVACVNQERRGNLVHTCQYPPGPGRPVGRTLNLFTAVYRLTVYEARTGNRLAAMEITGDEFGADPALADTDPCRAATGAPEDGLPGRRHSRPSHRQIEQALTPFVAPAQQRIRAAR